MVNYKLKYLKYKLKYKKICNQKGGSLLHSLQSYPQFMYDYIKPRLKFYNYNYQFLFNLYDANLQDMRTFLMVKLQEPYITFTGEERTWHPFYISSGTGSGAARKGRPQPFFGYISSYMQMYQISGQEAGYFYHFKNFFENIYDNNTIWKMTYPDGSPTVNIMKDYFDNETNLSDKKKNLYLNRIITDKWMIKCPVAEDEHFMFPIQLERSSNPKVQKIFKNIKTTFSHPFFEVNPNYDEKICNKEQDEISQFLQNEIDEKRININNLETYKSSDVPEILGDTISDNNIFGFELSSKILDSTELVIRNEIKTFLKQNRYTIIAYLQMKIRNNDEAIINLIDNYTAKTMLPNEKDIFDYLMKIIE